MGKGLFEGALRQPAQKLPAAEEIDERRRQKRNQHGGAFRTLYGVTDVPPALSAISAAVIGWGLPERR